MSKRPCWGRTNMSPSLLQKAFISIDVLARYIWTASPSRRVGSPLPATVFNPSTKSTLSEARGRSKGCHASWVGLVYTLELSGRKQDSSLDYDSVRLLMRWSKFMTYIGIIRQASKTLVGNGWSNAVEPPKGTMMSAYVDCSPKKLDPRVQVLGSRSNERWTSHLSKIQHITTRTDCQWMRVSPSHVHPLHTNHTCTSGDYSGLRVEYLDYWIPWHDQYIVV